MLAAIFLASQWHFPANKHAVLAGCSAFWPVNCIFLHKKTRTRCTAEWPFCYWSLFCDNSTCSENTGKFKTDVEIYDRCQNDYANYANTEHLEKLTNLSTDNRNECTSLINETGTPEANDSEMPHLTSNDASQINTHCISIRLWKMTFQTLVTMRRLL